MIAALIIAAAVIVGFCSGRGWGERRAWYSGAPATSRQIRLAQRRNRADLRAALKRR